MMNNNVQTVPYDVYAEQSVLGALILGLNSNDCINALNLLKPESFYLAVHQQIFKTIKNLNARNLPIDLLTVDQALKGNQVLEEKGRLAYLAELSQTTPSRANVYAYAQIVRDCAVKRFAISKLHECENLLLEKSQLTAEERLDVVSRLMSEIADYSRSDRKGGLKTSQVVAEKWLDNLQRFHENPNSVKGLSTGLPDLDNLLGVKGLAPQTLAVVGARPKCGKTAFYAMIANQCVLEEKKTALLFSLEMSDNQIFERLISQRTRLNPYSLYQHNSPYLDESLAKAQEGISQLIQDDLLLIDDSPNISMAHIRNECRRIKRERGEIGLVAVDYLTLMKADQAERNDLAYGNITKELKNLARELDCVVLLLTQLNRSLESRADKRPLPSDSRDTGQIEQECDYWFGLYKDSVYNEEADPYLTEVHLKLNRYGETGKVYCEQKFGAMFPIEQADGESRAIIGMKEPQGKGKKREF